MFYKKMVKSIVLIAVIAAVMIAGALAVTMTTTGQAFANSHSAGRGGNGGRDGNGVNGGNNAHDPCDNAGPAEHNPNCSTDSGPTGTASTASPLLAGRARDQ